MDSKYELASKSWDDKEIQAIHKVIESDRFSMGENVENFESDFAKFLGSKYCVMVNSGSSSNLLMVAALTLKKENPLKPGDEVIVPAVSWSTTYYPLQQYGLKLKFVDIDLETLNFDIGQLEKSITDKTRCIFAVNLLGNSNEFDKIQSLIDGKKIYLMEDNCESLGATFEGKQLGTFGIMGSYSTYFSHHISTMEGGIISTDDKELYHILLSIRSHGWTRHLPEENLVTGKKSSNPFEESFKFVLPGFNVRPIEMSGAIGVEQLKKLPNFVSERRKNAKYFVEKFSNSNQLIIQKEIGESSWFGFSIILKDNYSQSRSHVIEELSRKGIESRPIVAGNFTKNSVIKYFDYEVFGSLKNSDLVDRNGFFVGNHHYDIRDKIDFLYETLVNLGN